MRSLGNFRLLDSLGQSVTDFLDWWLMALGSCVPQTVRNIVSPKPPRLILAYGRDDAVLTREWRGGTVELWRRSRGGIEAVAARRLSVDRLELVLDDDLVFKRRLILPAAAERKLRAIIFNEIDRQTPFSRDEVYFDCHVVDRDRQSNQCQAEIVIVKPTVVEEAGAAVASLARPIRRITMKSDRESRLDLIRGPRTTSFSDPITSLNVGLVMLILSLSAAHVIARSHNLDNAQAQVQARLVELKGTVTRATLLQREIKSVLDKMGFISAQREAPSPLEALSRVTTLMPDDTWIFQFQMSDREVRFSGYAGNASTLLESFGQNALFSEAKFRSPVTRTGGTGLDRLDLSATLRRPGELP